MADILVVIDKLELKFFEFNDLVTNFWIIKTLLKRNHNVFVTTIENLFLQNNLPFAYVFGTKITNTIVREQDIVYDKQNAQKKCINDFNMVLFRPDPPVNINYINATYIFDFVDEKKVKLVNKPSAIRNFSEKLHINFFPEFIPEAIVTSNIDEIKNFVQRCGKCIIKPLNKCFGANVFMVKNDDLNTNTIIKLVTNDGSKFVMVQKFVESSLKGDKRILILGDKVLNFALNKIPNNNDFKFSTHNDSHLSLTHMTQKEFSMVKSVAEKLNKLNLPMAGLDVIEDKIIEINVTSPCYFIREINNIYNIKLHEEIADFLENFLFIENIQLSAASSLLQ